ncbi:MAG: cytochrome c3 family protein [Gemmatimonadota bacterium]|nr:cytochrome c3 family protein [Gemmatimonadota bacterium]
MRRWIPVFAGVVLLGGGALLSWPREDGFPHRAHEGLFPTCEGCHRGVATGDTSAIVSIDPDGCASCHDGTELERVEWEGPELRPTNLEFSHPEHESELEREGERALDCTGCHRPPGAEIRMAVGPPRPETCFECHAPGAEHYAMEVDCSTCHLPLAAATGLPVERIAGIPEPSSHGESGFLFAHGGRAVEEAADCAVCHTRDSCERCHLNAADVPAIARLPGDPRVATLVAEKPGEWPEPESHQREDWPWTHEEAAIEEIAECANCHARSSCAACHGEGQPRIASRLPEAQVAGPAGVRIAEAEAMPVGHNETFFDRHATAATIGVPDCASCHEEKECIACHDGVDRPGFHPLAFVVDHGAEAFANRTECEACHAREAFCRDCHTGVNVASRLGRSGVTAYHDAQPDWLLAHGQAARQNLETCVSCHQEDSCLRCHSARSGWRVSPHGPDFDPGHAADKSTQSCGVCHFGLPEGIEP